MAIGAVLIAAAFVYRDVASGLVSDWLNDDNYSHGLLVAPLAALIVWQRRARLAVAAARPSGVGLLLVAGSLGLLIVGTLGAELFTSRVSLIGLLAGTVWFVWGFRHLQLVAFPLGLLLLTIPLPEIVFNQIALPLQSLAARAGEAGLVALKVPVLREGNVIVLATGSLEVAEACSGIRSLMSLVALAVLYGHFTDPRGRARAVLAVAAFPIAIIANAIRVAGTGIAASHYGAAAAEGFFHTFSGWLMFVVALGLLMATGRAIDWMTPSGAGRAESRAPEEAPCGVV